MTARRPRVEFALFGLVALALTAVGVLGYHVNTWALDETVIKQSAVHYTSNLPHSLLHDINARGTSRAYPLLISPLFRAFDGHRAVQLSHVVNVVLWLTAFFPARMLAARLGARGALASVAGALVVLVPWLAIASVLYTENLAYPAFVWAVWAVMMALWQPAWWRDVMALGLIGLAIVGRVQLAPLVGAYWLCVLFVLLRPRRRVLFGRRLARDYPLSSVIFLISGLFLARTVLGGTLHARVVSLLGSYAEIQNRKIVPSDYVRGLLVEALAIGVGVGVIPGAVALDWAGQVFRRGQAELERQLFAAFAITATFVMTLTTLYAQNGFVGPATEERYYMYFAPFAIIACVVAVSERSVQPRRVLPWVAALALLMATVGLPAQSSSETAFVAPVNGVANWVAGRIASATGYAGLTRGDVLFWCVVAVAAVWLLCWRLLPRGRGWVTLAIPAVVQLGLAATAFAMLDGRVGGIQGRTGSGTDLAWVDHAAGSAPVAFLNSQVRPIDGSADFVQRQTLYFNDQFSSVLYDPERPQPFVNFPMSGLPLLAVEPGKRATGFPPLTVQQADSPFGQLAGGRVARGPVGGLELVRTPVFQSLRWRLVGPNPDGTVPAGSTSRWSAPGGGDVRMALRASAPATVVLRSGASTLRLTLRGKRTVLVSGCRSGTLAGVRGTATVTAVRVAAPAGGAAACRLQ
jgi:hypothetical protein